MKKLVDPVMAAYAKEIGAEEHLRKINVTVSVDGGAAGSRWRTRSPANPIYSRRSIDD